MTEPIAVDVPGRPAFPRSAPLPVPRVDSPPKADAPKLAPPPVLPSAPAPTEAVGLLARLGKKQLVVGASAVFSLVAGIGAVRLMFPAKDEPRPTVPAQTQSWAGERTNAPALAPPVAPPQLDVVKQAGGTLPPIPDVSGGPVAPAGGPPTELRPTVVTPVPHTTTAPPPGYDTAKPPPPPVYGYGDTSKPLPPPTPYSLSVPSVLPAGGMDPARPGVPPATPAPPLPALPTPPGGMTTPVALPAPPPVAPGVAPSVAPPAPDFGPLGPTAPATPTPKGPIKEPDSLFPGVAPAGPAAPALPPLPTPGTGGVPPLPAAPMGPAISVVPSVPENKPPGVFPSIDAPPKPSLEPPVGMGTPTAFTKPGGTTEVKPVAPEFAPKTGFDVDLHDPKANDSYESISLEWYNDRRYAAALRAFNQNKPLQGGHSVDVPPIHILKRRFPAQAGGAVTPVGGAAVPSATPQWGPAGDKPDAPARAVGAGRGGYVVPPGGMTMKAVARLTLGNEQRWRDIYDLNSNLRPDDVLPPGTELKLPADARLP